MALTLLCFGTLWAAVYLISPYDYWLALLLVPPAAGFLVRIFLLQHECGHGTLFRRQKSNDWAGRFLGILTLTPYDDWRNSHAQHHAGSSNLDRRGIGDIDLLTVEEFVARGPWGRFKYRLYRHPLVMFGLGPTYLFLVRHRFPSASVRSAQFGWFGVHATNAGIACVVTAMVALMGWSEFLKVQIPITILASSFGVWLFYIQHQFEGTFWARQMDWSSDQAALVGCSYYDLPAPLEWLTANIGLHHLHHLSSRIPFYRLREVMKDNPELGQVRRLRFLESFHCVTLALWDEKAQKLVSFGEAKSAG